MNHHTKKKQLWWPKFGLGAQIWNISDLCGCTGKIKTSANLFFLVAYEHHTNNYTIELENVSQIA